MSNAAMQRTIRRYGFPFRGLVASVDRHEAPLGSLGQDSRNLLIEPGPVEGLTKVKRRHGATIVSANTGATDTPVADASLRGLELFELPTHTSTNGFPVIAGIFGDESKRYGLLWYNDGGTDHVEGEEFGTTHYPVTAVPTGNIKVPPIPYDGNGATGYNRLAYEENRRRTIAGTRRRVGVKNWEYDGGFYSTPTRTDRGYNLSSGSGSNNYRRLPTGLIPPLWAPTVPAASYPTRKTTAAPWKEGDTFFLAVAFEDDAGHVSMPFIPRDKNATLTNGLGLIVVDDDADGTVEYFDYIPYRDIPIGPHGTAKRRIYRSNKIAKDLVTGGSWPDIGTLKLCAIIENNTSTAYNDERGNDAALFTDPLLRTDQVWPARGRCDWAFDHRHATGYLRPNPCAIVCAPSGLNLTRDLNASDDSLALPTSTAFIARITLSTVGVRTLHLRKCVYGAAPAANPLVLSATNTLQSVVDTINSSGVGGAGGEWVAQMVPGADANAPADTLAPTYIDVATCTTIINTPGLTTAVGTDYDFRNVAEGMKVSHANYPAGTYVKSKTNNTTLVLSANATASSGGAPVTIGFHADVGDDVASISNDGTLGNMRAWANSYPVVFAFTQAQLDLYPTEKRDFMMTSASPSQRPNAANLFHTSPGGRYQAESEAGIFMGAAPLKSGCICFYSNWIGYYRNERSGSTGEDADFRMKWIDKGHGCKSPYSIVSGNDWAGCWTDAGFWCIDSTERQAILSGDVFDENTGKGELNYENTLCCAAAAADTNDFYMHAHFRDGRIWLGYRIDASNSAVICYDCSPSIEASGIGQLLTREGELYGWSARCQYSWRSFGTVGVKGAIGSARTSSTGIKLYQCDDLNDKTTGGLVQEFETTGTYLDGAGPVEWKLYSTRDMLGGMKKFSLGGQFTLLYRFTVSSGSATLTVVVYRDQQRAASTTYVIADTSSDTFTRKPINPKMNARSSGEVVEFYITGGSGSTERIFELSGIEAEADVLESLT